MRFDIVTFGSAVVDAFVETGQKGNKIEYKTGSKILVEDLRFDIGGGATNTAVAFSRLGFKTGAICNVGDDENGSKILNMLEYEGVEFLGSKVKGSSGYSVILDSKGGGRTILTYKGPGNSVRKVEDFECDWLYYSSVLGASLDTQMKLAQKMKKRGTKLAFNPSEYLIRELDISGLLSMCDIVILNKEEFDLVGERYKKSLLEICSGVIVVTNKDKLVWAYSGDGKHSIKPGKVKVVERTGAGDAFASGFVSGQIAGFSMDKSLKLGLKEGESVLGHFGAKNNLIRRKLK